MSSNPIGKLVNLKQNGSLNEYQRQFQALLALATLVYVDQQVNLYTAGLSKDLRADVEVTESANLATLINLTRGFEKK